MTWLPAVGVAAVFVLVPTAAATRQLRSDVLAQWLCQAVLADRPEQLLGAFPGAESSPVETEVKKLWADRPGRLESPTRYTWRVRTPQFAVEYTHLERPGQVYQFRLSIRPALPSSGDRSPRIFASNAEITRWLGRVGTVRAEDGFVKPEAGVVEEDLPEDARGKVQLIQPYREAVADPTGKGGHHWRVAVRTERQDVDVQWYQARNKKNGRGFCSS